MSTLRRAIQALPMTFAVYVVEAVCALLASLPLGMALQSDSLSLRDPVSRAALLDRAPELLFGGRVAGGSLWLTGAFLLLGSPCLQMAWFSALLRPTSVRRALEHGARLYVRAALVTLFSALLLLLALTPWGVGFYLNERLLGGTGNARLHDLTLLALVLPCLLVCGLGHVVHDLARARCLGEGPLSALRGALRRAFRVRCLGMALSFAVLALALRAAHAWVAARSDALGDIGGTLVLQSACFGALFVRSLWLGWACQTLPPTSRPTE